MNSIPELGRVRITNSNEHEPLELTIEPLCALFVLRPRQWIWLVAYGPPQIGGPFNWGLSQEGPGAMTAWPEGTFFTEFVDVIICVYDPYGTELSPDQGNLLGWEEPRPTAPMRFRKRPEP